MTQRSDQAEQIKSPDGKMSWNGDTWVANDPQAASTPEASGAGNAPAVGGRQKAGVVAAVAAGVAMLVALIGDSVLPLRLESTYVWPFTELYQLPLPALAFFSYMTVLGVGILLGAGLALHRKQGSESRRGRNLAIGAGSILVALLLLKGLSMPPTSLSFVAEYLLLYEIPSMLIPIVLGVLIGGGTTIAVQGRSKGDAQLPRPQIVTSATGNQTFTDGKPAVDAFGQLVSTKSRLAAALLAFFFGVLGIHRFYVGKLGTGVLMIVTFGGLGIWALVDLIMILAGYFKDLDGRRLNNW